MNSISKQACVAIIAGEASGDQHGAKLVKAMLKKNPVLFFCGIGGPALRQAGVRILVEASELAVVGITEVWSKIPVILKSMGIIKKLLKSLKPDLLILIDFPDFNLHVAAAAKKSGRQKIRYSGIVLYQPSDMGLAPGPGQAHWKTGRSYGGHTALRAAVLQGA
jgi:lipid A disaccharide synthetase